MCDMHARPRLLRMMLAVTTLLTTKETVVCETPASRDVARLAGRLPPELFGTAIKSSLAPPSWPRC